MKHYLSKIIKNALKKAQSDNVWPDFDLEQIAISHSKNEQFGDYSTNIAMVLAKKVGKSPMEVAGELSSSIKFLADEAYFAKIEVASPGYINFYLAKQYLQESVLKIKEQGEHFGDSQIGTDIKINNEFISANPTGPLHLGNGRAGFFNDALTKVLRKSGFTVDNEYYINDAGGQVVKLGHSVLKDSEAVYAGEYIEQLHGKYANLTDSKEIGFLAAQEIVEHIIKKTVTEGMKISYDIWTSEKSIQEKGLVEKAIGVFKQHGFTYENEGALWLKTTEFGDEKDRVLVKSNGEKSYFASDCGYLLDKIDRSYDRMILSLGADHHGYVARMKAAASELGFAGDFRIMLFQMVRLVKDGKEVRMSKRAGNVVYIDDLLEELGHEVARFFFLMYSPDTHMNFDMGLAQERSQKNPVFYVQYAHARICSILKKAESLIGQKAEIGNLKECIALLQHEKELSLIKELNKFPELIEEIADSYAAHKLPHFSIALADKFHSFYDVCRVIDEGNVELTKARLLLVDAVRIVLAETLRLIGVSAPEKM